MWCYRVYEEFRAGSILIQLAHNSPVLKYFNRSTCEAELVGADDASTKILWTKYFLEAQGYEVRENILYQDNKSTILLLKNGKASSGKQTRAINI